MSIVVFVYWLECEAAEIERSGIHISISLCFLKVDARLRPFLDC